jgi:hypothetical protein
MQDRLVLRLQKLLLLRVQIPPSTFKRSPSLFHNRRSNQSHSRLYNQSKCQLSSSINSHHSNRLPKLNHHHSHNQGRGQSRKYSKEAISLTFFTRLVDLATIDDVIIARNLFCFLTMLTRESSWNLIWSRLNYSERPSSGLVSEIQCFLVESCTCIAVRAVSKRYNNVLLCDHLIIYF